MKTGLNGEGVFIGIAIPFTGAFKSMRTGHIHQSTVVMVAVVQEVQAEHTSQTRQLGRSI